jgi:ParB-like chromosome segregation protein Spo0J
MSNQQMQYEIHPAATIFPLMDDVSFAALKADIEKNGQQKWITFYQGKVLDGRNRLRACQELGIDCEGEEIEDDGSGTFDPYQWVLSMNLHRRHLTESQRAMIGGRLATLKRGDVKSQHEKDGVSIDTPSSIEKSASMLNVGRASVARAKQVLDAGSKEIIEAVDGGTLPVSFAAKFVTEEPDKKTQTQLLKKGGKAALKHHITEPSPFVDDGDEKAECAVKTLKKLWKKWDALQRTAVRVWIDEHYTDV